LYFLMAYKEFSLETPCSCLPLVALESWLARLVIHVSRCVLCRRRYWHCSGAKDRSRAGILYSAVQLCKRCQDRKRAPQRPTLAPFGLSTTRQQYFSLRTNQSPVTRQQYFSLWTNQHHLPTTSQTNRLSAAQMKDYPLATAPPVLGWHDINFVRELSHRVIWRFFSPKNS
jgi:hypothetical protein